MQSVHGVWGGQLRHVQGTPNRSHGLPTLDNKSPDRQFVHFTNVGVAFPKRHLRSHSNIDTGMVRSSVSQLAGSARQAVSRAAAGPNRSTGSGRRAFQRDNCDAKKTPRPRNLSVPPGRPFKNAGSIPEGKRLRRGVAAGIETRRRSLEERPGRPRSQGSAGGPQRAVGEVGLGAGHDLTIRESR